jgi:hypothetical protein
LRSTTQMSSSPEIESGLTHSEKNVYTSYPNSRRDEWETKLLPVLKKVPLQLLVTLSGMARSTLIEIRAGRSRPHPKNQELLAAIALELGLI